MTDRPTNTTSTTRQLTPVPDDAGRKRALREQARREIPALRRQAEHGIETLKRLSRAASG